MRKLIGCIRSIMYACPYSIVGRKCVAVIRSPKLGQHKSDDKRLKFRNGIRTGTKISLIGVFCPILWFSILSGQSRDFIFLNVIHSGIIAGIGLLIVLVNYLAFIYHNK